MTSACGRWGLSGLVMVVLFLSGCGGGDGKVAEDQAESSSVAQGTKKRNRASEKSRTFGKEAEPPTFETVPCRIYTPEPGFLLIVDGVQARTEDGKPLLTPCEVGLRDGEREILLVKEKHEDLVQSIIVGSPEDFEFKPSFKPFNTPRGYLASRFINAEVGEPIPLLNLNTGGPVVDPFITNGGRTLYFAGNRKEGRGIFFAQREHSWDDFGDPELIRATRGADVAGSPSVTADGTQLVYLAVGDAKIFSVDKVGDEFTIKKQLKVGEEDDELWDSAQISGNGLSLYATRDRDGDLETLTTTRDTIDDKFDGGWLSMTLPGSHPVITADGLRQFAFDGRTLTRASRLRVGADWSKPSTVIELNLPKFERSESSRQFTISDDEQWMFYADNDRQGNLFTVKLSREPRWGYVPRGQSVTQKTFADASSDEPDPDSPEMKPEEKPATPEVDPRTLPLPYVAFRAKLEPLVQAWKFDEAEALIAKALEDPAHEKDKEVLGWDREDVQAARIFTEEALKGLQTLKPGDEIRVGVSKGKFLKLEGNLVTAETGGKEVQKPVHELTPTELTTLAEKAADRNETFQLRVAAYYSLQARPSTSQINSRAARAGVNGRTFQSRLARRKLHLISQEFDRENVPAGLKLIEEVVAAGSRTETATEALRLKDSLFTRTMWEQIGGRTWDTKNPGEYVGGPPMGPAEGAYLLSPKEYHNFSLSLEWRTIGGPPAQGGVFFRYPRGKEIRDAAYKIHLGNDAAGPLDKFATGSLFGKEPPKKKAVKPEGQWNTLLLRVEEDKVQATINGELVLDTKLADPAIPPLGNVALDGEFIGISYRKIVLYELPKGK